MKKKLEQLKKEFDHALKGAHTIHAIDAVEQRFFARKNGELSTLLKLLSSMSGADKKMYGEMMNILKEQMARALSDASDEITRAGMSSLATEEAIDVTQTLSGIQSRGHIHPTTQSLWDMEDVARDMGFIVEDGPELDSDYYVFEALNIPKHHPARDAQDTFYIKNHPDWCMRSHVSNMQVRLMQKYNERGIKSVRLSYPGRVFRNEAIDATHEHTFYQWESLMVDREINIGHMIGVIQEMLKGLFKRDVEVRLRPSYFPFVEPGLELDMKLDYGKGEKWLEMLGCGLIHPHVLREAGYDPHEWQGFAYAFGLDRLVIAKYGIEDIRHFHSGDMRFLEQF